MFISYKEGKQLMNSLGSKRIPFLFVINFELNQLLVKPLDEIDSSSIKYSMNNGFISFRNYEEKENSGKVILIKKKSPVSKRAYRKAFELVQANLHFGNSFLTNLTSETPIETDFSLEEIFDYAKAKYKLYLKDHFISFSPESFVRIDESGKIASFPMKGTTDAREINAREKLLSDKKEFYEHTTIVDLIRNDLGKLANKVWVERFRYIDKITREDGSELLQMSSEVCGNLPLNWHENIGTQFFELLPAGSISGAPKDKTLEIIKQAEKFTYKTGNRGFYTGVFGIFDGYRLDSSVLIRFIEKSASGLVFKSGGGITSLSECEKEYAELISKIYVPML